MENIKICTDFKRKTHKVDDFDFSDIFLDDEQEVGEDPEIDALFSWFDELIVETETAANHENTAVDTAAAVESSTTKASGGKSSSSAALAKIQALEDEIRFEKIPANNSYAAERKYQCSQKATKVRQKNTRKTHRKKRHTLGIFEAAAISAQAQHRADFSILDKDSLSLSPTLLAQHIGLDSRLPAYRELPERVLPCLYNIALAETQENDLKLYPFTFDLSSELIGSQKFQANPTGYLKDQLLKNLKRKLGREILFWFTLESNSQFGFPYIRPHVHGGILLTEEELDTARSAFRNVNGVQKKVATAMSLSKKQGFKLSDTTQRARNFIKREIRFSRAKYLQTIEHSGIVYATANWALYSTKHWTSDTYQWLGKKSHCTASESLKRLTKNFYARLRVEHKKLTGVTLNAPAEQVIQPNVAQPHHQDQRQVANHNAGQPERHYQLRRDDGNTHSHRCLPDDRNHNLAQTGRDAHHVDQGLYHRYRQHQRYPKPIDQSSGIFAQSLTTLLWKSKTPAIVAAEKRASNDSILRKKNDSASNGAPSAPLNHRLLILHNKNNKLSIFKIVSSYGFDQPSGDIENDYFRNFTRTTRGYFRATNQPRNAPRKRRNHSFGASSDP